MERAIVSCVGFIKEHGRAMPLAKNVGVNIRINQLDEKRSHQYFYPFFPISPLFYPLIFRTFQLILPCLPLDIINSRVVCFVFSSQFISQLQRTCNTLGFLSKSLHN